jgi:hypothetical protein
MIRIPKSFFFGEAHTPKVYPSLEAVNVDLIQVFIEIKTNSIQILANPIALPCPIYTTISPNTAVHDSARVIPRQRRVNAAWAKVLRARPEPARGGASVGCGDG